MLVIHFEYTYFSACYEMKKILFGCGSVFTVVMWSQNKATVITLIHCLYLYKPKSMLLPGGGKFFFLSLKQLFILSSI